MIDQIPQHPSWLKRNWFWLITISFVLMLTAFAATPVGKSISDMAIVSAESKIYEDAWQLTSENAQIKNKLGTLKPISAIDIIEGHVQYSNNNDAISMSVRLIGDKGKGKLDISATRDGLDWDYNLIKVRIKSPKETIVVLEN